MDAQVAQGHEVTYFFSGRQYPLARGPRMREWRMRGIRMLEVVNSPLDDHGRQPQIELDEPRIEALLGDALTAIVPDVCHVQELAGLPSSVLEILRRQAIPTVMTLQDYFALCSTFKLLDADGQVCLRRQIGPDCVRTVRSDPRPSGLLIEASVRLWLERLPLMAGRRGTGLIAGVTTRLETRRRTRGRRPPTPGDYQRRRDVNVARLNRVDVLVAMSHRVEEIYAQLGVSPSRLRTVPLTLRHIERLTPRPPRPAGAHPLTFATLAGFESAAKGGNLIIGALRRLSAAAEAGRFRLLVLGHVDPAILARAAGLPALEIRGPYRPAELDRALDEVDVGLVPSVWEEAYGYAGVEFLAKGIPVLANAIGGMPDYVREGETGWLNHARSANGLAEVMARLIDAPAEVALRAAQIIARRSSIITPHAEHVAEIERIYRVAASSRA